MTHVIGAAVAVLIAAGIIHAGVEDVRGAVTHVRDGDTIEVEGLPVRLHGLHAPELRQPGGTEAQAFMAALVRNRPVKCYLTGAKNRDRVIGVCYVDRDGEDYDLGELMVAAGMARDCPRYSGGRYAEVEGMARPAVPMPLPGYCR